MSDAYSALAGSGGGDLSSGSSGLSGSQWGTLGLGALGLGGLGYLASGGPQQVMSIPGYAQANAMVPQFQQKSALTFGQGQGFIGQGGANLEMAAKGQLTPEQAAQNKLLTQAETNQAIQTYRNMGRDPTQDTSFISTQQQIDLNATARAQAFIQSTIALAGQQIQTGTNLMGLSDQEASAATGILLEEGKAQVALNKQYSDSLTSAFGAVAKIFGAVLPGVGKLI